MSDKTLTDADGYVIVHHPADGSDAYCVGPFPPMLDLVERVMAEGKCDCARSIMPVGFPQGIRMAVDPLEVARGVAAILLAFQPDQSDLKN